MKGALRSISLGVLLVQQLYAGWRISVTGWSSIKVDSRQDTSACHRIVSVSNDGCKILSTKLINVE